MAYYRSKRGAFFIGEESSFGAGSVAQVYLKAKEVSMPSGMEYQAGDDIVQKDAEDAGSVLYQPGDVVVKCGLHPFTTAWPTAKPSLGSKPPISHTLKAVLGGVLAGGYGVSTSGHTTTVIQFDPYGDTPSTLGFKVGEPVYVRNSGALNILGANVVKTVDDVGNTITLRSPLPAVPGTAAIVYGGYCWPKLPTGTAQSYQATYKGEAATHVQQAYGCCAAAASIAAPYRGLAELSITFRSAQPLPMILAESGGAPSPQTYSYPEASQVLNGGLYLYNGVSSTKLAGGIDVDFGVELQEVPGVNGVDPNGIAGYLLTARKIRLKLNPAYTDNAIIDTFQNPPASAVLTGWWGRGAAVWTFQIPAAMLVTPPELNDESNVLHNRLEFGCGEWTGDTGAFSDAEAGDKPFVLGCLAG